MASDQEHQEQKALIDWFAYAYPKWKEFLWAVPNGAYLGRDEKTRIIVMRKLKAEGLKAGVPDLTLAIPSLTHHGMFIEMKATGRTWKDVSKEQKAYIERLQEVGYYAVACAGFEDARSEINKYMKTLPLAA